MFTKLQQVWDDIAQESLDRLSDSFIRRCQMVLDLDGESASGYLSSHRLPVPVVNPQRRSWSDDEDSRLRTLHAEIGPRWTTIGTRLDRPPLACKHRFLHLSQLDRNCSYSVPEELPSIEQLDPSDMPPPIDLDAFLASFT